MCVKIELFSFSQVLFSIGESIPSETSEIHFSTFTLDGLGILSCSPGRCPGLIYSALSGRKTSQPNALIFPPSGE